VAEAQANMSGNNPYSAHSPTQPQYIYSSPPRNPHPPHPPSYHYNSEQYHPPQTPPPYAPSGPSRSPHFGHPPSPLTTALPSINGTGPPQDVSPPYQTNGSPPQYRTQRSYSGSYAANNPPPSGSHYEYAPTSHSHPSNHHDMIAQSPSRENGDSTSKPWSMRPPPVAEHHAPAEEVSQH
jgi:DNA helicase INO80